ncbi:MAG TPA: hypothetical protein DIU00_05890 [Phycisphaerales bacterium]|nr:hypothetical protein [Phycisphaerales bacterium]
MHGLFTLIKRQIVDDTAYLAGALAVSTILLVMLGLLGFIYPDELQFHIFAILVALPAFVSIGCFTFGVAQTYSQAISGSPTFLSALPVTSNQILLSRVISGTLIIFTVIVLLAIAIIGGVLSELILWPESLFPAGLVDLFTGMFLVGLACYCLGLNIARKASTFTNALKSLPLALILNLLIVVKGFELPLIFITMLFIGASLLNLLLPSQQRLRIIVATGLQVMVLLGITIFWGHYSCEVALVANLSPGANRVSISDSGLLLPQKENEPDGRPIIGVSERIDGFTFPTIRRYSYKIHYTFASLGIFEYLRSGELDLSHFNFNRLDDNYGTYFNKDTGLVFYRTDRYDCFMGPNGISEMPDENLGRFSSPIIGPSVIYSLQNKRFFTIDLKNRTLQKGPVLTDSARRPIQIIGPYFRPEECSVFFSGAYGTLYKPRDCRAVLDESGRIDLLDLKTLDLTGPAGFLPRPRTHFGWGSQKPKDLLAYDVNLLSVKNQQNYVGMAVGSLSRQGTTMALAVFDKEGNQIKTAHTKAEFFKAPWEPTLMVTKYIFESLHPPVLTLASFFTAYSFDACSTHRALFLMPNSFVAMARDYEGNIFYTILIVLLLMLPGILFAFILGWRVKRDAAEIGLPCNARRLWLAGTLVFGLAGYITYRLTRPKVMAVTCTNCGNFRRPDMDICHNCGSKWVVPELKPPKWRVFDRAEQFHYSPPPEETTEE